MPVGDFRPDVWRTAPVLGLAAVPVGVRIDQFVVNRVLVVEMLCLLKVVWLPLLVVFSPDLARSALLDLEPHFLLICLVLLALLPESHIFSVPGVSWWNDPVHLDALVVEVDVTNTEVELAGEDRKLVEE